MSNGAVKVKWSTKTKCVVHNFIVRKHENGKVNITFAVERMLGGYIPKNWIRCILLENILIFCTLLENILIFGIAARHHIVPAGHFSLFLGRFSCYTD